MGQAVADVEVEASLAHVWGIFFDPATWPAWLDGFGRVESVDDTWPDREARLVWQSGPTGRGTVTEEVLEHDPRRLHRVRFDDEHSHGELETRFEIRGEGVRVEQCISYALKRHGVLGPLTDVLFIRNQMRRSLERTLQGLRLEARERPPGDPL